MRGIGLALVSALGGCCLGGASGVPSSPPPVTDLVADTSARILTAPPDRGHAEMAVYWTHAPAADPIATFRTECADIAVVDALAAPGAPAATVVRRDDYAAPDLEGLAYFGRGLEEADAIALQRPSAVLVVTMEAAPERARDAVRVLETCIARVASPDAFVWDEEVRLMYSLAAYRAGPVADWDDGAPSFIGQVTVHAMPDDDAPENVRAVSLGMRRFARSDLTIPRFGRQHIDHMGQLLAAVARTMLAGPEPDGTVHVTAAALREGAAPTESGGEHDVDVTLRPAVLEDGDADNRLLEIVFPGDPSTDLVARESAFLAQAFGEDRVIGSVAADSRLDSLSAAARAELATRRDWFLAGVPSAQHLQIAVRLSPTSGEVVWLEVEHWADPDQLQGSLLSEPNQSPGLHVGDDVRIAIDRVQDYTITGPEGLIAGGAAYDYMLSMERR